MEIKDGVSGHNVNDTTWRKPENFEFLAKNQNKRSEHPYQD